MKVKLLKRIRKNWRIIEVTDPDGVKYKVQEKYWDFVIIIPFYIWQDKSEPVYIERDLPEIKEHSCKKAAMDLLCRMSLRGLKKERITDRFEAATTITKVWHNG
jgi:hypothetical protein